MNDIKEFTELQNNMLNQFKNNEFNIDALQEYLRNLKNSAG